MFPLDGNKAVFHFCSNAKPDVDSALICSFPRKAEGTLSFFLSLSLESIRFVHVNTTQGGFAYIVK